MPTSELPILELRTAFTIVAQLLIDEPGQVRVDVVPHGSGYMIRIAVAGGDVRKLVGVSRRTARSLRVLAHGMGQKYGVIIDIDIVQPEGELPLMTRASQRPRASAERTLRSRSIAFIGLGILAASAVGENVPLYTCENGLIALNPPLTPSRAGSCSTRTMHPFYLDGLRESLSRVGIINEIINPYSFMTKGEAILDCGNLPLVGSVLSMSASCSHGARRQVWTRKEKTENCGYVVSHASIEGQHCTLAGWIRDGTTV